MPPFDPRGKSRFRTPEGRPEMRTPEEMLRDAVSDDEYADLPGKGKPLKLDEYFKPGEENRMAGKLLKDNKVLPPQLQERKDAEEHLREAEKQLEEATTKIDLIREAIRPLAQQLALRFSGIENMASVLDIKDIPEDFQPTSQTQLITSADPLEITEQFDRLLKRHNGLVRNLTHHYLQNIQIAQENIESSHKRQLLTRTLQPTYAPISKVDVQAKKEEFENRFALLPELPDNWQMRIKDWRRTQSPSLWNRVFQTT